MLKAYKYRIYPNKAQKELLAKHLAAAVLPTIRRWHTGKKNMRKKRNPWAGLIAIITVIEN